LDVKVKCLINDAPVHEELWVSGVIRPTFLILKNIIFWDINLLGIFDPEDGDDMFHRNVSGFLTDYTALYPGR
jgi:hypothetical protein